MRQLKVCLLALFAVFALAAATAATASALPDIHILEGEEFPLTIEGSALGAAVATLSTPLAVLTASHVAVEIECEKLSSLCPYTADFKGVTYEKKLCHTIGDGEGEVLVTKNEVHLVELALAPPELVVGADFLVAKFTIICVDEKGELKVTVEGQALAKLLEVEDMVDVKKFSGDLKCTSPGNGKQEVKEYYNDEEKLVKGILKANVGLGNETACEEVKEPLPLEANKMVVFLF